MLWLGIVANAYDPNTLKAEAGESLVKARLSYMTKLY